jgi:hypothetical protein
MSELQLTDESKTPDFSAILNQKKLTNVETAKVLRVVVRRLSETNRNALNLQEQNKALGERMDRMEDLILDKPKPGGGVRQGLAHSLQATQKEMAGVEQKLSQVFLSNQVLSRVFVWAFGQEKSPSAEELSAKFDEIHKELVAEGEKAAAAWPIAEDLGRKQFRCAGCKHWKDAPKIVVPGVEQVAGCTKKLVQVKCPQCGHLHGLPLDPNNLEGKCVKCQNTLYREIELPEDQGTRTMCQVFEPDVLKLREALKEADIPMGLIEQVAPLPPAASGL